ncbi:MAG TPA: hypothetical protein VG900_10610 [Hyphomicrobiaceae bacterium]|nr:hypothetical protein [Hyphomicrobiaceae bacterium]
MVDAAPVTAANWLNQEDERDRQGRVSRLQWLAARAPKSDSRIFHDGMAARVLFEEARYCFVYGQFVAVILLGVAFIERSLAARIYGAGDNALERAHLPTLLPIARERGWLTAEECARIDALRDKRNPLAHFRGLGDPTRFEWKAVLRNVAPYTVFEEDARTVLETALHYVERSAI